MAKKKISQKRKKSATEDGWLKVNPDRPFPPPKPKKRKNRTVTKDVFKCGICNEPIQATNLSLREFYFCDKCTRGPFGKLGMWFVDLFVVFKSFILGK